MPTRRSLFEFTGRVEARVRQGPAGELREPEEHDRPLHVPRRRRQRVRRRDEGAEVMEDAYRLVAPTHLVPRLDRHHIQLPNV